MECPCECEGSRDPRCAERGICGKEYVKFIDIVFDGPPGHEPGRFVEVENHMGCSVSFGEWVQRGDGYWVLRLNEYPGAGFRLMPLTIEAVS